MSDGWSEELKSGWDVRDHLGQGQTLKDRVALLGRLLAMVERMMAEADAVAASLGASAPLAIAERVAQVVRDTLQAQRVPFPVLCQGDAPRTQLVEQFRADPSAVLLGTASLWTGVDVQGDACVAVVIDKMPFPVPSDPVNAAIDEAAQRRTNDKWGGFREESLPRATLAVRQGAGRLIRGVADWGAVIVCDPRLTTARYGPAVVRSLGMGEPTADLDGVCAWLAGRVKTAMTGGAQ
jgi:ATP-dependent DNA helicase DinG